MAITETTNHKKKKDNRITISSFLAEVKPVKNLDESLANKNPLYNDPTYIELINSKGYKKNN